MVPPAPSTDGYINTCRDTVGFAPGLSCGTKLTVNGSFIAQRIVLQRTKGSLRAATTVNEPAISGNIAEVFQMSPQFYIGQPVFKEKSSPYDSIKGLPPVL